MLVLRERVPPDRLDFAPLDERAVDERPLLLEPVDRVDLADVDLRAPLARAAPDLADLARVEPAREAAEPDVDERFVPDFVAELREPVPELRVVPEAALRARLVLLPAPDFDAPERDVLDRVELEARPLEVPPPELRPLDPPSSSPHLPDSTRCAASATASAISEPSRVALDTAAVAARDVLSAASRPASRILRRAAGLALIAAAAAASPAASISRLIAAFAILSTVVSLDDDDEDDLFLLPALAIADLPLPGSRHIRAVTVP